MIGNLRRVASSAAKRAHRTPAVAEPYPFSVVVGQQQQQQQYRWLSAAAPAAAAKTAKSKEVVKTELDLNLRPSEVVAGLDAHIVGQHDAKRAVAIAMRNRWRRKQLPEEMRKEVTPRNVLLVGPTGCGKTEGANETNNRCNVVFVVCVS